MDTVKRWYDINERLSILMSHLEKSPHAKQRFIAEKITQMVRSKNIVIEEIPSEFVRKLRKRWYDQDEIICLAVEHLKIAPTDLQIRIAEKLLLNMNKIDKIVMKKPNEDGSN